MHCLWLYNFISSCKIRDYRGRLSVNIKLYVIGNKFDKFCYEGIKEYEKRLSRYGKFKMKEFKNPEQLIKKLSVKTYKIGITNSWLGKLIH